MLQFRLKNGQVVKVKTEDLDKFREKYPNATAVGDSGSTDEELLTGNFQQDAAESATTVSGPKPQALKDTEFKSEDISSESPETKTEDFGETYEEYKRRRVKAFENEALYATDQARKKKEEGEVEVEPADLNEVFKVLQGREEKPHVMSDDTRKEAILSYKKGKSKTPLTKLGTIDFSNKASIDTMKEEAQRNFLKTSSQMNKVIIPKAVKKANQNLVDIVPKLKDKYNLNNPKNITQENVDAYNKEIQSKFNMMVNSSINSDKDFSNLLNDFQTILSEQTGVDYDSFTRSKDWEFGYKLELATNAQGNSIARAGMNYLRQAVLATRRVKPSLDEAGAFGSIQLTEKYKNNILEYEKEAMKKYLGSKDSDGKFQVDTKQKGRWRTPANDATGAFKFVPDVNGNLSRQPGDQYGTYEEYLSQVTKHSSEAIMKDRKTLLDVAEKNITMQSYKNDSFEKLIAGDDVLVNAAGMAGEQLPTIAIAMLTMGIGSGIQMGSDMYVEGVKNKVKQKFNLSEQDVVTPEMLQEVLKDEEWAEGMVSKSIKGGVLAGFLERFGAGKVLKNFTKGKAKSIMRGGLVNFAKRSGAVALNQFNNGATEAITEVLQEIISAGVSGGETNQDQLFKAGGTGFITSIFMGGARNMSKQVASEVKSAARIMAGKLDSNSSEAYFNSTIKEFDAMIQEENNPTSKQDLIDKRDAVIEVRNANAKIPKKYTKENRNKVIDLMVEAESLRKDIEGKDDALVGEEKQRLKNIIEKLQEVERKQTFEDQLETGKDLTNKLGFEKEPQVYSSNDSFINSIADDIFDGDIESAKKAIGEDSNGVFAGKGRIYINKAVALDNKTPGVIGHEVLHPILNAAVGNLEAQQAVLPEFKKLMSKEQIDWVQSQLDANVENKADHDKEFITYFAEGIQSGDIKYDETTIQKIGRVLKQFIERFTGAKILDFKDGKEVFEFVKNYNMSMKDGKGKISKSIVANVKAAEARTGLKASEVGTVDNMVSKSNVSQLKRLQEELDNLDEFDFDFDDVAFNAAKANIELKIKKLKSQEGKPKVSRPKKSDPLGEKIKKDASVQKKRDFDNEALVAKIKDPLTSEKDKRAAEAELTDSFDAMALDAIKYDTSKGDIDMVDVRDYLRQFLPSLIEKYDPSKAKFSTMVYNNMGPKAQQTYQRFLKIADKSLDVAAGETGSVKEIAAQESGPVETSSGKKTRTIDPVKLMGGNDVQVKYSKAVNKAIKDGNINLNDLTFGNLNDLAPEVTAEVFDLPILKVTDPADNLTKQDIVVENSNIDKVRKYYPDAKVGMIIPSEAGKIRNWLKRNISDFKAILPQENVAPELATVDAAAYVFVKGTGLKVPPSLLKSLYEPTGKRSKGKTSQVGIKKLKDLSDAQVLEVFGIVKGKEAKYDRVIGQRLKAVTTLIGKLATNVEVRKIENISDIATQNISAGKSSIMFSKSSKVLLNKYGLNYTEITTKEDVDYYIENMVKPLMSVFNSEDYKLLNRTVLQFRSKSLKGGKVASDYIREELSKLDLPSRVTVGRTKPSSRIGRTVEEFKESLDKGIIKEYNERNSKVFDKMWSDINNIVSKDKNMAVPIMYFLENSINEATNPHRMGAPVIGYQVDAGKLYYEHAVQSQLSYLQLMESILDPDKDFDVEFAKIKDNYKVIAISEASNNKLEKAGYSLTMPDNWKNWYDRYFNKKVASIKGGINPRGLFTIDGVNFSTEFGIDSKGNQISSTTEPTVSESKVKKDVFKNLGLRASNNHDSLLDIQFSKKKRKEYEDILSNKRPDISNVSEQVDELFKWADNLKVKDNKKSKYKKLALYYMANGYLVFPEDGYKVQKSIELSEANKIDPYAYKNPDELINKFIKTVKAERTDPDSVKEFTNKKTLPEGIIIYDVKDSRKGQEAVRNIVDTHWGEKSNPWCLIARSEAEVLEETIQDEEEAMFFRDGLIEEGFDIINFEHVTDYLIDEYKIEYTSKDKDNLSEAWKMWENYNKGGFGYKIAFQNGRLISFRDGGSEVVDESNVDDYMDLNWWDRFDKPTQNLQISLGKDNKTKINKLGQILNSGEVQVLGYAEGDYIHREKSFKMYNPDMQLTNLKEYNSDGNLIKAIYLDDFRDGVSTETSYYEDGEVKSVLEEEVSEGQKEIVESKYTHTSLGVRENYQVEERVITQGDVVKNSKDLDNKKLSKEVILTINGYGKDGHTSNIRTFFKTKVLDNGDIRVVKNEINRLSDFEKSLVKDSEIINESIGNISFSKGKRKKGDGDKIESKLSNQFNKIIQKKTGIPFKDVYSKDKAAIEGANKGRFKFFVPPSAEDFVGLLYATLGEGKVGDGQMAWYKKHVIDTYSKAMGRVTNDRVKLGKDFKELKSKFNKVPKSLDGKVKGTNFTKEQAVRVWIWDQLGEEIPGFNEADIKPLLDFVNSNEDIESFAVEVMKLNPGFGYAKPKDGWITGTISTDMMSVINEGNRKGHLELWQQNVDQIFSKENLNKLEAVYGVSYRKAMENILARMKAGKNRIYTTDTAVGKWSDWLNGSVGAIMFFNTRSAVLQTISAMNFMNWTDNNPLMAAKAFANVPQWSKDFKKLFNSEFLVDRRDGLKINVSESEIADIAKNQGVRGLMARLLKFGFKPTQLADSFAIASGGASFYRNRTNTYIKDGMDPVAAEKQAMIDFRENAEESQQSSRPDKISQEQAGPLGRVILAFANTPGQYTRIMKKAALDIKNKRGDLKTNISKILYYGAIQNFIFTVLQNAALGIVFGDDEDEGDAKKINMANGALDSVLRGSGVLGAIVSTVKNALLEIYKQENRDRPDYDKVVQQMMRISPPLGSKYQKIKKAGDIINYKKDEIRDLGFDISNPAYLAGANAASAMFNLPADRLLKKATNLRAMTDKDATDLQRLALLAGWSKWDLGLEDWQKNKGAKKKKSSSVKYKEITYKKIIYKK